MKLVFLRSLSMYVQELACQQIRITPIITGSLTLTLGMDFSVPHRMFKENFWNCVRKDRGTMLGVSKNIGHRLFAGMRVDASAAQTPVEAEKFVGVRLNVDLVEGHE